MTTLDQTTGRGQYQGQQREQQEPRAQQTNVGAEERAVSLAAGAILTLFGLKRFSLPGLVMAGVGGAMVYRGVTGYCPVSAALGIDTAHDRALRRGDRSPEEEISERGIHVEQAYLINRTPDELYTFWRNFENLPRIMTHLESVTVAGDGRSHWVARAPRLAGGQVEWDAEITADEPDARIAWRSLPGSDVDNAGEIRFTPAMGDRGTEVRVLMDYVPPAGRLGHWVATVFGEAPRRQIHDDLRNFKRLMECGEIVTTEGQPHGTCTGRGTRS